MNIRCGKPAGKGSTCRRRGFFSQLVRVFKKSGSQDFFEKACLPSFKTFRIMVRDWIMLDWIFMVSHHCILFPSQPLPFYQKCQDIFQRILVNQISVSAPAIIDGAGKQVNLIHDILGWIHRF